MPTSTPRRRSEAAGRFASCARGFTLLEIAIILFIVGIAATLLMPRLRDTDRTALTASAARLATTARFLYEEAAFRQTPLRLHLDLDEQVYWVTVLRDDLEVPEFLPDASPLAAPVPLPPSVRFADAVLPALGTVREGVVFAQFSPEGYSDPLVVHLRGHGDAYATFAIDPLTGRTRVAEGYHDVAHGTATEHPARRRTEGTRVAR